MTKSTFLKIALAVALATPVVIYGLMSSPEAPPELGEAPRAQGPTHAFRMGDVEPSDAPRVDRSTEEVSGERVRGDDRAEPGPQGDREARREERREERSEGRDESGRERGANYGERLAAELSLSPEQAERVQAIFERARGDRSSLRELSQDERRAARQERRAAMDAELREILDPQQMERMQELRNERSVSVQAGGTQGERRNGRAEETRYREGVDARGI